MKTRNDQALYRSDQQANPARRRGLVASGSVIGAILASSCCILPFVLFSLAIGLDEESHGA